MKRFFFTVIALATVAVGCTKSGLLETPQTYEAPITFEPYTGKAPTTKATIMDEASLKADINTLKGGFHVTAFPYTIATGQTQATVNYSSTYMDEDVWWQPESGEGENLVAAKWDYEGVTYWPESSLDFVAYGLNAERHMTFNNSKTTFTYNVPSLVSDQEDLIVSNPIKGKTNDGKAVNLPFKHLLAKVGFSLQTNYKDPNVKVLIKEIQLIGNFYSNGTVDMTSTTGDGTNTKPYITRPTTSDVTSYTLFGTAGENNTVVSYDPTKAGTYDCFVGESKGMTDVDGTAITDPIYASHTIALTADDSGKITEGTPAAKSSASEGNRYMMIIPTDVQNAAKIRVVYQLTGDIDRTAEASLANTFKFEAGNGYEFVLKVSTLSVDFAVNVTDWQVGDVEDSYTLTPVTPDETE